MSENTSEALPPGTLPVADFKNVTDFIRSGFKDPPVPVVLRSLLNILQFAVDVLAPTDPHPLMASALATYHVPDTDAAVKAMDDCCEGKCPKHATGDTQGAFNIPWNIILPVIFDLLSKLLVKQ